MRTQCVCACLRVRVCAHLGVGARCLREVAVPQTSLEMTSDFSIGKQGAST